MAHIKLQKLRLLAAFLLLCLPCQALAQNPSQWGKLQPGPYPVGFRVVQQYDYSRTHKPKTDFAGTPISGETAAPMQIGLWYPAKAKANAGKMRYEDYLYLNQKAESFGAITQADKDKARESLRSTLRFAFNREMSEADVQAILNAPTAALREAEAERGPFPVILGGFGNVGNTSVLAEYLASHGYLVATIAGHSQMGTLQATKPLIALEWHTRNFEYLLAFLHSRPQADLNRSGVLGVNFDGMAALNFQMRNQTASAVVSLDGYEGKNFSSQTARQSPWFDVLKLRVPYLLFLQDKPPSPSLQFDPAFFASLKYSERSFYQVNNIEHSEYVANPLALPLLSADKRTGVEFVYQTVLHFFNAHVKKDAASLAALKGGPETQALLKTENKQTALPPAPTADEFEQLLGVSFGQDGSGVMRGIDVFRAAKKANPELELFSVQTINMFAFRMLRQNKKEEAIALLKLGVEAYPQSVAALNNLGIRSQELGQKELARECFEQALALLTTDSTLSENERAQTRSNLLQKLAALKTQ